MKLWIQSFKNVTTTNVESRVQNLPGGLSPAMTGRISSSGFTGKVEMVPTFTTVPGVCLTVFNSGLSIVMANKIESSPKNFT